jgi:hypothetical protein
VKDRKIVQVQMTVVLADVVDGEIGDTVPVQITVSGRDWASRWATAHSRRAFDQVAAQVAAQVAEQQAAQSPEPVNREQRRAARKPTAKKKG